MKWTPPTNSYKSAFMEPPVLPTVKLETGSASAYEQERIGQHSETSNPVPISHGEIASTSKGDYLQQFQTIVTATETYDELVTMTDIGAGSSSLIPVVEDTEDYSVLTIEPDRSQGQLETAPTYDVNQVDNPFYQPETAQPPVWWEPLPVEQAPVDEPQYVQGSWSGLAASLQRWHEWQDILGFTEQNE